MLYMLMQDDMIHSYSGTRDKCHQLSMWPNVKYCHNLPRLLLRHDVKQGRFTASQLSRLFTSAKEMTFPWSWLVLLFLHRSYLMEFMKLEQRVGHVTEMNRIILEWIQEKMYNIWYSSEFYGQGVILCILNYYSTIVFRYNNTIESLSCLLWP